MNCVLHTPKETFEQVQSHIWKSSLNGYYFVDETENFVGPYPSEHEAAIELICYDHLL